MKYIEEEKQDIILFFKIVYSLFVLILFAYFLFPVLLIASLLLLPHHEQNPNNKQIYLLYG